MAVWWAILAQGAVGQVQIGRNTVFVGARVAEQLPIMVDHPLVNGSVFRARHRGVEFGYTRRVGNSTRIGLEVYAYVSRYGFSGELMDCGAELNYTFPFTSEGVRKGIAAYDPLIICATYQWDLAVGRGWELRPAVGLGAMPYYSRFQSFTFASDPDTWQCQNTLDAQLGYGESIYPIIQGSVALGRSFSRRHGFEVRAAMICSVLDYYSGYVSTDLLLPTESIVNWQRRFIALSVALRYNFSW